MVARKDLSTLAIAKVIYVIPYHTILLLLLSWKRSDKQASTDLHEGLANRTWQIIPAKHAIALAGLSSGMKK